MIFSIKTGRLSAAVAFAVIAVGTSCVKTDGTLGQDYIPSSHIWKIATATFDIDEIEMQRSDELGGYSSKRVAIGGIYDTDFGWGERVSAFTLIPLVDTLTFSMAEDAVCTGFHFALAKDTLSFREDSQERILQAVQVYELLKPLDNDIIYSGKLDGEEYIGDDGQKFRMYDTSSGVITEGIPIYNGGDSLVFELKREFGQKYLDALKGMKLGDVNEYAKQLPGIVIKAERPMGSGRINLFQATVGTDDNNYLTGNYVLLRYRATFDDRGPIDTTLVLLPGLSNMIDSETSTLPGQYVFNFSTSEELTPAGIATDKILVEGGSGLKPVIRAEKIKSALENQIRAVIKDYIEGYEDMDAEEQNTAIQAKLAQTIVNRATITLPYEHSENFDEVSKYPKVLSPTCRMEATRTISDDAGGTSEQKVITFAGLTDASVASENQGNINRSLNRYQPDFSHHAQEILRLSKKDDESEEEYAARMSKYDIWMLIMHPETTTTSSSGDSSYNDYLNALAYSSYYNNLYGYGGYGYGSYGYGYDSYYNNYYNYMMMAAYASQSSTTTTSSVDLDKDRYYNCHLYGPSAEADKRPKITVTFSFPKE